MNQPNQNEQISTEKLLSQIEKMASNFDDKHDIYPTKGFLSNLLFEHLSKAGVLEQADPKQTTDLCKTYKINKLWALGMEFYTHEKLANEKATRRGKRDIREILSVLKPIGVTLTAPGKWGKLKYICYEDFTSN